MKLIKKNQNSKKRGAALVEYGLLVAGVALTTAAAVSLLGHKTNDMVGTVAGVMPSSNIEDTGSIQGGRIIATTEGGQGATISIDFSDEAPKDFETMYGTGANNVINDSLWD